MLSLKNIEYKASIITGSTIRNCDKVNTWLDQIFWQIYQKLILSGFLSSGNLCLIHHLNFFDLTQPLRPPTEKVLKFNMSFHDSVKIFFFKNSEESDISPQIIEFKNLEDSAVIFQALETSPASLMSVAWQPHWPQQPLKPNLLKKFMILMVWSSLSPKKPLLVILCGMDHQNPIFH